jgi:D-3-phosphoglycerate dehydrogenase
MDRPGVIILNAESSGYCHRAAEIVRSLGELRGAQLDRTGLLASIGDADVLIVRLGNRIDAEVLDKAPRLRVIVSATTGLDHIDLEAARARGITVLSLRGETDFLNDVSATAEHTWALLLALLRKLPEAFRSVRAGEWDRDRFRGRELSGKRLGILGLGRLGTKVACYGISFGMSVVAFDPYRSNWLDGVVHADTVEHVLSNCDVLTLHVPLSAETKDMIGPRELGLLVEGSILLNTSRGELVDETALLSALEAGRLAGAAVDVVRGEQDHRRGLHRSPLVDWAIRYPERLLITPHVGGATVESMEKTEIFMAQKLATFLGRPVA